MAAKIVKRLPGMEDISEEQYLRLKKARDLLQSFLSLRGYKIIDTPIVEPTEIFLRKSAGELSFRLYTFTEPGGHRVTLRPEFTSGVIRGYIGQGRANILPLRWQYSGPVFRYEGSGRRQFTQVGVELIGCQGAKADGEVVALAVQALAQMGVRGHRVVIGHVGVVRSLLEQLHLSERVEDFLLGSITELRRGPEGLGRVRAKGEELALFRRESEAQERGYLLKGGNFHWDEVFMGNRTQEEVVQRLGRKLRGESDVKGIERGLALVSSLSGIRDVPSRALQEARALVKDMGLKDASLQAVGQDIELLTLYDLGETPLVLDFGLARNLAYYTGLVFEVEHPRLASGVSLAGGGRYDGLMKAMGASEDIPAAGFASTLEVVLEAIDSAAAGKPSSKERTRQKVLVMPRSPKAYRQALRAADTLRLGGEVAEMALEERPLEEHLKLATEQEIKAVIVVDEDGQAEHHWAQG